MTHCQQNLSPAEVAKFNHDWLQDLQHSVLVIKAVQTGLEASKATPEQCDVVEKLCVCKGAVGSTRPYHVLPIAIV